MVFRKAVAGQWSGLMWEPKGAISKEKENNLITAFGRTLPEICQRIKRM